MFDKIIAFSLKQRLLVLAFAAALVVYGTFVTLRLPVDVFPDLNRPTVTILTEAEGLAPEEVESLVTFPIETAMNGAPGVVRVRSNSGVGLSIVFVEFEWGTDIYRDRQLVNERLGPVTQTLPAGARPVIGPISSVMGEIMLIGMTSDGSVPPMRLRTLADWTVRTRLLSIPGVAQVIPIGGEVRQYQVLTSPARLQASGVSQEELEKALRNFARNSTGGFLDQQGKEYLIRNIGQTTLRADLRKAVVAYRNGTSVTVGQVADVVFGAGVKRGDASVEAKPAVIIAVQKQPQASTIQLTRAVEAALAELKPSMPAGVRADQILFRQAAFIERAVANVMEALRDGAILVAIVLFAFLANVRTTAISLTAIPLSIVVTALVFNAFGLGINTMTLGGIAIAIGELVDDAVIDVENVFRRLRENRLRPDPLPVLKVIADASGEVRNSIVYATVIVVLVFVPLFALSGIEGRLFAPLGVAYIVSILASMFVSLTVTPAMCAYLLPRTKAIKHGDAWLVRRLKRWDTMLLNWSFRHPGVVIGTAVTAAIVAAASVPLLGRTFLPPFNEGTVTISVSLPPGTSLAESNRIGTIAETLVRPVPEVVSVGRRTGRAELDEHAEGVHTSEIDVDLKVSNRPREAVLGDIRNRLALIPGVSINIGQPISHRLDHILSGVRAEIVVKIFGPDLSVLRRVAEQVRGAMSEVPGVVDLQVEKQVLIPQIQIRLRREEALKYGLSLDVLSETLEAGLRGKVVSQVYDRGRVFNVVVRLAEDWRSESRDFRSILIDTPAGKVPLSLLADVIETTGPNIINRDNAQRRIAVFSNTSGRDVGSIVADIQKRVASLGLPEGYRIAYEGQFKSQEEAGRLIALLGIVSLLAIFIVLYSEFRSAVLALVIMGNIPMALVGSVAAIWVSGLTLSVATMVGFITLTGIAARNGIMKISHYLNLCLFEGETFSKEMIVRGSLERLTPVLMTALVAAFALVPLVLAADEPGREILHPVAVVIFAGLLSSTVLDTIVTPVIFWLVGKKPLENYLRVYGAEPSGARRRRLRTILPTD